MPSNNSTNNNPDQQKQSPLPSTGEGSGSALDVLKKKRGQQPNSAPPPSPDQAKQ